MTPLGLTHTGAALVALASGAAVLLTRKGTARHRAIGWAYAASMMLMNGTALFIYRLFGGFGPFHAFAIFSVATVLWGTVAGVRARRHRQAGRLAERAHAVELHYTVMTWSYVGLVAAAVSEIATRLPAFRPAPGLGVPFAVAVAASTLLVVVVGGQLIRRRKSRLLAPYSRGGEEAPLARAV